MRVAELWRYPVKSMAGERLDTVEVTRGGIVGDRVVHVEGPGGRVITSRTHPRLLGLRVNHPVGQESLERSPRQPASRAEAAYSLAKLSLLDPVRVEAVRQVASTFSVPALGDWQRLVLTRALRFVGYPYVFAGMSEKPQTIWSSDAPGNQLAVPGGFDCSGFVWRVYKLQP